METIIGICTIVAIGYLYYKFVIFVGKFLGLNNI